jgi:hypothetical protein
MTTLVGGVGHAEIEVAPARRGTPPGPDKISLVTAVILSATSLPLPTPVPVDLMVRLFAMLVLCLAGAVLYGRRAALQVVGIVLAAGILVIMPGATPLGQSLPAGASLVALAFTSARSYGMRAVIAAHVCAMTALMVGASIPQCESFRNGAASLLHATVAIPFPSVPRVSMDYADLIGPLWLAAIALAAALTARWRWIGLLAAVGIAASSYAVSSLAGSQGEIPTLGIAVGTRAGSVVIGFLLVVRGRLRVAPVRPRLDSLSAALALTALGSLGVLAWAVQPSRSEGRAQALVLDRGLLDWNVANFQSFGDFSTGMFGELQRYFEVAGIDLRRGFHDQPIADADLVGMNVVVLINDGEPWKVGEVATLERFMEAGGCVLALCDHTNAGNQMKPVNELIGRHGIRLRFDSAYPQGSPGWASSLRGFAGCATSGLSGNDFRHAVGCSLDVQAPASPLLVGSYALADRGEESNVSGAFLGNYKYDSGESFGGLVVAAEAPVGKGRLVVYGDTSAFQNAGMMHSWVFAVRVLHDCAGLVGANWPAGRWAIAVALLATMAFASRRPTLGISELATWTVLLTCIDIYAAVGIAGRSSWGPAPGSIDGGTASVLIESSVPSAAPSHESTYRRRGDGCLIGSLLRNGCLVYIDTLEESPVLPKLVVVDNPSWNLRESLQRRLIAHAEGGGAVLVVASAPSSQRVSSILDRAHVEFTGETLGAFQEQSGVSFGKDVGVPGFIEPWAIASPVDVTVIASAGGRPVVTCSAVGRGYIAVVGDPSFLENRSLDPTEGARPENQMLLASLLRAVGVSTKPRFGETK